MRVCFVLPDLSASGGIAVARAHAERLRLHNGIETDVVLATDGEARRDGITPFAEAQKREYDVAIATWWTTLEVTMRIRARQRALFMQGPDERFFPPEDMPHRLAAALPLRMPLEVIAVSTWLARLVETVRPEARAHVVPNGVDKQVFKPTNRQRAEGPLRVLIEGAPQLWFKGVEEAVAAVRAMREPAELTLVALHSAGSERLDVDRVASGLAPREMAALYAEHDVLVKLSRFEGLALPPLEAFHVGLPCVVTPYGGHEDYVVHGQNGIVVGFDDSTATTAWLDRLASDQDLLDRLGAGALATAAGWPDLDASSEQFAAAVQAIAATTPPAPELSFAAIAQLVRIEAEMGNAQLRHLTGSLEWTTQALEEARMQVDRLEREVVQQLNAKIDELFRSRDECSDMLERERATLAEIKQSRAYRTGLALRKLKPGG